MPKYFFDLSKGDLVLRDHVGVVLADIHFARDEALKDLIALVTSEYQREEVSRVEVRDDRQNLLLTVTAGEAGEQQWKREGDLAADLARWAEEQRMVIRELGKAGRDVSVAEELLESITHLYAGRVAARVLKKVSAKSRSPSRSKAPQGSSADPS